MSIADTPALVTIPDPAPRPQRDARGRFAAGNTISAAGGRGRAAALSRRRRRAIARRGYRVMVRRHFGGDDRAQRKYFAALGAYNYEVQAGAYEPGSPLRPNARHPGPVQDWRSHYYTQDLFTGDHTDVDFWRS